MIVFLSCWIFIVRTRFLFVKDYSLAKRWGGKGGRVRGKRILFTVNFFLFLSYLVFLFPVCKHINNLNFIKSRRKKTNKNALILIFLKHGNTFYAETKKTQEN